MKSKGLVNAKVHAVYALKIHIKDNSSNEAFFTILVRNVMPPE